MKDVTGNSTKADFSFLPNGGSTPLAPEIVVLDGVTNIFDGSSSVNFGNTTPGVALTKTITVTNSGTANLTLSSPITLPAGFSLVSSFATCRRGS